jgi:hypothetical protein
MATTVDVLGCVTSYEMVMVAVVWRGSGGLRVAGR